MAKLYSFARKTWVSITCGLCLCAISHASAGQPVLGLAPVISGLTSPMQLVHAGDATNRFFIVQKGGAIRVFDQAYNDLGTFLTVTGITTAGERGLLSMAFHPLYEENGFLFVFYTNASGSLELARYVVSENANVADAASKVVLLTIPHPGESNHNGGEMHFGNDGLLYVSTGDGGGSGDPSGNAQNTTVLLGKMLRIAVTTSLTPPYYTIPPGNPYSNEIYDLGLRNPFRWSFDRQTQDMWIGDVGQDSWEEINFRPFASAPGVNYGWRCYEGNTSFNTDGCGPVGGFTFPVYTYATQNPAAAITGGVVYRGSDIRLQGYYVSADFYSGTFYKIVPDGEGGWTTLTQALTTTGIVDFGEAENGDIFAVSLTSGSVYSVSVTSVLPVTLLSFTGNSTGNSVELTWTTSMEEAFRQFDIEYSTDGTGFTVAGVVAAKNTAQGATYKFSQATPHSGQVFYRLRMVDIDGSSHYSDIVTISINHSGRKNFVNPSIVQGRIINLFLDAPYHTAEVVSMTGAVISRKSLTGRSGRVDLAVPNAAAGTYVVRLRNDTRTVYQRVVIR